LKKITLLFVILIPAAIIYPQNSSPGVPTVSYGGQTYHTVQIGTQCWLKENLNVGSMIKFNNYNPYNWEQTNNNKIEKFCYDNDTNNCATFGGLYQWAEVVNYQNGATNNSSPKPDFSGNVQGICPAGWHIPTIEEFGLLDTFVDSNSNALKLSGYGVGSGAGTNTSGYSGKFSGSASIETYHQTAGFFFNLYSQAFFWSASQNDPANAYYMCLYFADHNIYLYSDLKDIGLSVRCLNDEIFSAV